MTKFVIFMMTKFVRQDGWLNQIEMIFVQVDWIPEKELNHNL